MHVKYLFKDIISEIYTFSFMLSLQVLNILAVFFYLQNIEVFAVVTG